MVFQSTLSEGRIAGQRVLLQKPGTFMNESGQAVGAALRFFKLPVSAVTVFYDDLDLKPGKVKVKTGGGAGGASGSAWWEASCMAERERLTKPSAT